MLRMHCQQLLSSFTQARRCDKWEKKHKPMHYTENEERTNKYARQIPQC